MGIGRLSNTKQNPILCLFSIGKFYFVPILGTDQIFPFCNFLRGTCYLKPCVIRTKYIKSDLAYYS